jgi:quercetin dioxygenase-like cupin family protein
MTQVTCVIGLACASAMVFGGVTADSARAGEQPIKRTELLRADLAGTSGRETVIYIADLMPAAAGGRHTHYGNEFVYIIEGSLIVSPDGKDSIT